MFAPHCPRCHSRVLLGPRRIVRAECSTDGRRALVLRCHCGQLVVDDLGGDVPGAPDVDPDPPLHVSFAERVVAAA